MGLISDKLYQVTKLLLLMSGGNGRMIVKSPDSYKDMTKTSCFSLLRGSTTLIGARQPDRMRTVGKIKKRKRGRRRRQEVTIAYATESWRSTGVADFVVVALRSIFTL